MSTVRSTLEHPVDRTVVVIDTPLMRSVERHPAGRGLRDGQRPTTPPRPRAQRQPVDRTRGRSGYRLTRRGRFVVFLVALLAFGGLTVGLGTQVIATSEKGEPVPSRPVTVQPGETVWDLAADANPTGDIRETVQDIADLNALPSAGEIGAGETIYVPIY
ncbi:LysM peptidoglycan-binding domain-containing protein [Mumia sp. DW29H23]|uniref:LysM peptidoglycan-binding domain-containing protein n=1 Tax=Mumia sp. DW29H23 TaxID=3421241 RepID=UPI003D6844ED